MIYAYCPGCDSINEAKIISKRLFAGKSIICQNCKERVVGQLIQKKCEECGNILYVPLDHAEMEIPCKATHEQERNEARIEEEKKEQENRIRFSMREIPCQHCQGVVLRLKYGKYECCPNCGNEPSEEYILEKWRELTQQKPGLIQWTDPAGKKLIHVDQRTKDIPPYSLLIVEPGYYVQYSSDGGDWKTLENGTYALFRVGLTEEEKLKLANENAVNGRVQLSLGLNTRILFFHEAVCGINCPIPVNICDGRWKVTISATIHLQISRENVGQFMGHSWNLTDDQKLTGQVERIVQAAAAGQIEQYILDHVSEDDSVRDFDNENNVRRWFNSVFSFENRQNITEEVNMELCSTYGITMPVPITNERVEIIDLHRTETVECVHCKHINYVQADAYNRHEDFICNSCKATMLWCNTCGRYVTNRKRFPARACDIGDHMIW